MAHNKFLKRVLAILLTAAVAACSPVFTKDGFSFGLKAMAAEEINGCTYLTENSSYRLYLRESNLSLVVEDKKTGSYMTSAIEYDDGRNNKTWTGAMNSAVVITMINGNDDTKQADLVNDNVKKKIKKNKDGFEAELYWDKYKFGLTLKVSLTEDGLKAFVPDESIREDGDKFFIGTVALYPYMGSSYIDSKEGYILVPDGNGALIYLNDKEERFKSGFSGMIYGGDAGFVESNPQTLLKDKYNTIDDSEQVIAPVYGIAHTDDKIAYLAVVEDGEARANIECIPNGAAVDYNRAYAKFILRKTYTQPTSNNSTAGSLHIYEANRSHSDLGVRFLFLSGDNANYTGMATAYREYLMKQGTLKKLEDSYKTRIDFLGTERESWVLGTKSVVMTTTEDIRSIYEELDANGVKDILSVYKGWQKGGLYNIPISTYKAEKKIGGTKELTALIKESEASGKEIYLYNNALLINPEEKNATFNVVKQINKRRYEETTYRDVYEKMLYLTPARTNYLTEKFVSAYTQAGVNRLAVAGISNTLFSYTYSGDFYTRYDTQKSYLGTVDEIAAKTELVLEQPAAYLWADTKAFLDMPLYSSSYIYEDETIPFLSIVLKGIMPVYGEYVNFEANKKEFFLKMIESGTYPSFLITKESSAKLLYTNSCDIYSSEYSSYQNTIISYDAELKSVNKKLEGAVITGHEIRENEVRVVTYSNGIKIYLNYGSTMQTVDGVSVAAMSYEVK